MKRRHVPRTGTAQGHTRLGLGSWVAAGIVTGIWQGLVMIDGAVLAAANPDGRSWWELVGQTLVAVAIASVVPGVLYGALFGCFGIVGGLLAWAGWLLLRNRPGTVADLRCWIATAIGLSVPVLATEFRLRELGPYLGPGFGIVIATIAGALVIAWLTGRLLRRRDRDVIKNTAPSGTSMMQGR